MRPKKDPLCDCGHTRKNHSRSGEWCKGEEGEMPCLCGGFMLIEDDEDEQSKLEKSNGV